MLHFNWFLACVDVPFIFSLLSLVGLWTPKLSEWDVNFVVIM